LDFQAQILHNSNGTRLSQKPGAATATQEAHTGFPAGKARRTARFALAFAGGTVHPTNTMLSAAAQLTRTNGWRNTSHNTMVMLVVVVLLQPLEMLKQMGMCLQEVTGNSSSSLLGKQREKLNSNQMGSGFDW